MAHSDLNIPERRQGAAVQRLEFCGFQCFALLALPFALEPELVIGAAIPGLGVPHLGILLIGEARFQPVDQQLPEAVVHYRLAPGPRGSRRGVDGFVPGPSGQW